MNSRTILTGLMIAMLGFGCSKGRDQYDAPGDQTVDKKTERPDTEVPGAPTSSFAGLVEGLYYEKTADEEAAQLTEAVRSPINPANGLAGVDISMDRTSIETKVGQPDFVALDSYLQPIAVYGGGSFLIFYDRITKNKVEMLIASNGYVGGIPDFGFKVGSNLAPVLEKEGGPEGLMKKLYAAYNPGVSDCVASQLCQRLRGTNLSLLALTNTVQILYQDDPTKPEKNIFEIRVLSRTPDAGRYSDSWNVDLLSGSLSGPKSLRTASSTWADVRDAGSLDTRVEARDFGRTLSAFSVNLSNDLGFAFARSTINDKASRAPLDSDKLIELSMGGSFDGTLSIGGKQLQLQLCKTAAIPDEQKKLGLTLTAFQLKGKPDEALAPASPEPVSSNWVAKVAADADLAEGCVGVALKPDIAASLKNSIQAAVESEFRTWLEGSSESEIHGLHVLTSGFLEFATLYDPRQRDPSGSVVLPGNSEPSLGLGKLIFDSAYAALLNGAKEAQATLLEGVPQGLRSLEEKATFIKSFALLDEGFRTGRELSVYYFESSKTLLFATTSIDPAYSNHNSALSLLTKGQSDYSLNLDSPFAVEGITLGYNAAPGMKAAAASTFTMNPFDRSMRYAELKIGADEVTDYATYAERFVANITDGTTVVSKTHDVYLFTRGISVLGKRVSGRSETESEIEVQGIAVPTVPVATKLALSCSGQGKEIAIGQSFDRVYDALKDCKRLLTPGYGAERVPAELHIAPEGVRPHGLTLTFTEGALTGFFVYNAE